MMWMLLLAYRSVPQGTPASKLWASFMMHHGGAYVSLGPYPGSSGPALDALGLLLATPGLHFRWFWKLNSKSPSDLHVWGTSGGPTQESTSETPHGELTTRLKVLNINEAHSGAADIFGSVHP